MAPYFNFDISLDMYFSIKNVVLKLHKLYKPFFNVFNQYFRNQLRETFLNIYKNT